MLGVCLGQEMMQLQVFCVKFYVRCSGPIELKNQHALQELLSSTEKVVQPFQIYLVPTLHLTLKMILL